MSETPDLSTLPQRMRYAAKVIGEANDRLHYGTIEDFPPPVLLSLADEWEAEDRAAADREELVEQLARGMALTGWDHLTGCTQELYRRNARKLIESGWTKEDPA